jgi:hypothetical protein
VLIEHWLCLTYPVLRLTSEIRYASIALGGSSVAQRHKGILLVRAFFD